MRIGDAYAMLDVLSLSLTTVQAAMRPRQDLVLEDLLLRHQLAVLTRPTRRRSHARLRLSDKLLWVLARRLCLGWREHLSIVTPERSSAGIGKAGACSGAGSRVPEVDARI